jgi:hypothetical protein
MYYYRYRFVMPLLAIGAIVGFGSALHHRWHEQHLDREGAFERHIADVCADAALRAVAKPAAATTAVPR